MDTNDVDPVILMAVREKLAQVEDTYAGADHDMQRAEQELSRLRAARDSIDGTRQKLRAYLLAHSAELVEPPTPPALPEPTTLIEVRTVPPLWATPEVVIDVVKEVLSDGRRRRADELVEEMVKRGQAIRSDNPARRLTQIISDSKLFSPDRARGWGLPEPSQRDNFEEKEA